MRTGKDKRKAQLDDATRQMAAGKHAEAESILSSLLSTYPGDPEVCRRLATLHLKRGQLQVALSEIKFLATAAMRAQDYALAEAMIREYLHVDPKAVQLLDLLGQVYEEKGDRSAATEHYAQAVDLLLAHPDPELADLPAELYGRIKSLAPDNPVVKRLAGAFPSPDAPEVQYAASQAHEISKAPKPPAAPKNGTEEVSATVVSLESDADFRRLVSPPPETVGQPAAELVFQKADPMLESMPIQAASETIVAELSFSPTISPTNLNEPDVVAPSPDVTSALRFSEPSTPMEPEPVVNELPVHEVAMSPATEIEVPPPAARWTPYTEEPEPEPEPEAQPVSLSDGLSDEPAAESPPHAEVERVPRPTTVGRPRRRPGVDYKAMYLRSRLSRWVKHGVATVQFTGRLIVSLMVLSVVLPFVTVAILALGWLMLEQKPSEMFRTLSTPAAPTMPDPKRNGYFLLLGLGEPAGYDPMKAGYDRWQHVETQRPRCIDGAADSEQLGSTDSRLLSDWFRQPVPTSRFLERRAMVASWQRSTPILLARYEQWLTMPFDDVGYGTFTAPDCAHVLVAHRLYLAAGFGDGIMEGIPRLELDVAAWRNVLAHARTLTMKRLALLALDDDVDLLSDLLARPDLDGRVLPRLTRLARPLEPMERSLRYPMHDEFLAEVTLRERGLQTDVDMKRPWSMQALRWMPLPKQKALNAHAAYYDAAIRASETNLNALPSLYEFARTPPGRFMDYFTNPVDNMLKLETVPAWKDYAAEILETDARLRLAGLQARLRVPSRDGAINLLGRIAEAGPGFFDPFTGLPMLTNGTKTVLYSIGRDRMDNNADSKQDLTVPIFSAAPAL